MHCQFKTDFSRNRLFEYDFKYIVQRKTRHASLFFFWLGRTFQNDKNKMQVTLCYM